MFKIFPPTTTDLYLILLGGEYLHPFCFIIGMFKIFLPTTTDLLSVMTRCKIRGAFGGHDPEKIITQRVCIRFNSSFLQNDLI